MSFQSVTVSYPTTGTYFTRLISAAANGGPVLAWNIDPNNTIYLTDSQVGNPATVDSAALGPMSAIALDGNTDVYAFTKVSGQTAQVTMFPSGIAAQAGTLNITGNVNATVTGNVNVTNTPSVTVSGTPSVTITSGSVDVATTAPIDVSAATVNVLAQKTITTLSTTSVVPAGTTSGTVTQSYPSSAEGYEIECIPQSQAANTCFACDVTLTHLDASNNPIAVEEFSISNLQLQGGTMLLRGRILGTQISLQATVANTAWFTSVQGGAGTTATGVSFRFLSNPVYYAGLSRVQPVGFVGEVMINGNNIAVPASTNTLLNNFGLSPYCGPVTVTVETGNAGGFTGFPFFNVYQAGTTTVQNTYHGPSVTSTAPVNYQVNLPARIIMPYFDNTSTVAGSIYIGVNGSAF